MTKTGSARWNLVYDNLRERILTLDLTPGTRLTESLLAKEFDLSPTPVRDALGRLCQDGLVEVASGRGYTVAPLSVADIADICDLRFVIESGAIRLACERATPEGLERLRELSALTGDSEASPLELIARNQDFHVAIAALTGRRRIIEALERVMADSTRIFHLGLSTFSSHGMRPTHDELIDAIASNDVDRAVELCRQEAFGTSERVLSQLLRSPGAGVNPFQVASAI
ncbi:GntR family transcriptional regulator [Microbacterium sp. 18062]|uniref:GntR family transcriptional regulator n=1 Tax=Microbacterium sp. 18062 TaxID=2681410 RepID=UPI0013581F2D|nr:GntR family transcriptional regulator [Microbacterium sp. 18062]